MTLLWQLFIWQTLLIIASYHVRFPVVLGIDLQACIYFFHVHRLHQLINLAFLVGCWVTHWKKVENMFYYFRSRRNWIFFLLLLTYLLLFFLYLEVLPEDYLYRRGFFLLVAGGVVAFPYLFPAALVRNPIGFIHTDLSFSLAGKWGQTLPINRPETGIFVLGGQGSGKTQSIMEPLLFKMIQKGYAGIVYDYDFHPDLAAGKYSLSHLAYHCTEHFTKGPIKPQFLSINFQDLTTSARVNPIAPDLIRDRENLSQAIYTLLGSLIPKRAEKQDFWYDNTVAFFKSIVVFLANQYPKCCTLPHAIQLGLQESQALLAALASDPEAQAYASAILDAFQGSAEQFAGVISTLKTSLDKLYNTKCFWVLSGEDPLPIVNDPTCPWIVCLGNTPIQSDIIAPILSMLTMMMVSKMYSHHRNKSFLLIDELPTMTLPHLSRIPTTARKYKIATIVALQNMAQLQNAYTSLGAEEIQDSFANYFVGRGPLKSAQYLSELMGKKEIEMTSTTESDQKKSKNIQQKEKVIISPQDVMAFQEGAFMGKVVHCSGGFFKMQLNPLSAYHKKLSSQYLKPLPTVHQEVDVAANLMKIQQDVEAIISPYRKRKQEGGEA